jgi:putative flavoprotein involved in K+ transport
MQSEVRPEVIVIGGGQAGLAAGHFLARARIAFLILEAGARVGDSWRRRWDSLEVFTTARYSALPGASFPGDPEHYPGKDEVADYLEHYARAQRIPVRPNSHVHSLRRDEAGYRVDTASGVYHAERVIVATGAYQRPYLPAFVTNLAQDVVRLHSAEYRNPGQIPPGRVVVVGAANSGAGIATELAATHEVTLSQGGRIPHLPRRLLGKSLHWWGDHLGLIGASLNSWRGRTQRGDLLVGPGLRTLARRHHIRLVDRTVDAAGRTLRFDDGTQTEADAVICATGYRPDYTWIKVPVFDQRGAPIHRRGVSMRPACTSSA